MDIILIRDSEMKKLNKRWFGTCRSTDVITFGGNKDRFSEIYISLDAARRQAKERGISINEELKRLVIHGIVHAEGHDDTELSSFCRMREREWELLVKAVN